jgi:transcription factor IIIB subunit 2
MMTYYRSIIAAVKSPHLLIDFSDALQAFPFIYLNDIIIFVYTDAFYEKVNVYRLGQSFLQFSRILGLKLPIIDPSLYIHRYATQVLCAYTFSPL